MNIRKPTDYSTLFSALDELIAAHLPQMELYCGIGRLVSIRPEKGAAVATAEYLHSAHPDVSGFSPRNLRRMRDFYRTYEGDPMLMAEAITIGWTQNIVILEAELTLQEKAWYIRAVRQFGWSKLKLAEQIASAAHLDIPLDLEPEVCYTEENNVTECVNDDKDPLYLPRQHMPQPNGRVRDEGSGEEGRAGSPVPHRVRRHQHRGDRQPGLSPGPQEAEQGIDCAGKTARQLTNSDYDKYDLLIGMDRANLRNMHRICGGDFANKLHLLMDYTDRPGDVADPWYTDDFETTWRDVLEGCKGLLEQLEGS